jgi:hypothetical protein
MKLLVFLLFLLLPTTLLADPPLIIQYDGGGFVGERAREILNLTDTEVRILGLCASACTMYLGLPNVCVSPNARLVFHGPSDYGKPLTTERFDHWSEVMARHYPDFLRGWWMSTARHGNYTVSGREMIRHGVRSCEI